MEIKERDPSWFYGRSLAVFQGLPDPGPIEDLEDPVKVDKRKADLESQTRMMVLFDNELERLQAQINSLRKWLHTYYRKPLPKEGLSVIESNEE